MERCHQDGRDQDQLGSRARSWRACGCRAEQRDERAPSAHSITSSARASSVGGTSMRIARAVARLMMNSNNLVARATGMSAGFSPLRMRPPALLAIADEVIE